MGARDAKGEGGRGNGATNESQNSNAPTVCERPHAPPHSRTNGQWPCAQRVYGPLLLGTPPALGVPKHIRAPSTRHRLVHGHVPSGPLHPRGEVTKGAW